MKFYLLSVWVSALLLSACSATAPVNSTVPAAVQKQSRAVMRLLRAADKALVDNRLMTPIDDNAVDRYRAVQLLDPDNEHARRGLEQAVNKYIDWARKSIAQQRLTHAAMMLTRARQIDPDNAQVAELSAEIKRTANKALAQKPQPERDNIWVLDAARLDRHDQALIEELGVLAKRMRLSGETVLIVARNDREGRWIYQQMRAAVPGFRVRGNIELGRAPRIEVLPPI